jgi:hypothetical protein
MLFDLGQDWGALFGGYRQSEFFAFQIDAV